jgi:hypothetical protein
VFDDGSGNVLGEAYEHACEMICNAKTEAQFENALKCFEEKLLFFETSHEDAKKTAVVYFGRDTRESGERLVEKAKEGARALGGRSSGVAVKICDRGVVTTPMLHYFVYAHGKAVEAFYENNKQQEEKNDEDATERLLWEKIDAATQELAYFKRLAVGYLSLIEEDEEKKKKGKNVVEGLRANATTLPPLHIDCANGVGFVAFARKPSTTFLPFFFFSSSSSIKLKYPTARRLKYANSCVAASIFSHNNLSVASSSFFSSCCLLFS